MADDPESIAPRRRPPVRLIGVGGTGCRVVAALPPDATGACEVTAMDTDSSVLPALEHGVRMLLGTGLLRGVGRAAAPSRRRWRCRRRSGGWRRRWRAPAWCS